MAILLKQGNLNLGVARVNALIWLVQGFCDQVLKNSPADYVACAVTLFVPVASCESRQTRKDS